MEPAARKANGSTYAIGDVQGCFEPLERLLERVRFGPGDRAWLVGDLVNRGPRSLDVLRWAIGLGERATVVLGNHELSLLACAVGARELRKRDTFEDVLHADDADERPDQEARGRAEEVARRQRKRHRHSFLTNGATR